MRCLTYAIKKYREEGGYIVIRRSRILKVPLPHFLHLPENFTSSEDLSSFVPYESHKPHKWFPPLWFKGYTKRGDE